MSILGEERKISHTLIKNINDAKLNVNPIEIGKNYTMLFSASVSTKPYVLEVEGALSNGTFSATFGYPYAKSDTGLGVYSNYKYWVNTFSTSTYCTVIELKNDVISMIDKKDIPTVASVGEDNNFYRYDDNMMVFVWRNRGYLAECVVVKY